MISLNLSKDQYFLWLIDKVGANNSYTSLCGQLHKTKFTWTVPNDDNRISDGIQLRYEFLEEFDHIDAANIYEDSCSMLELLLGISNRMYYDTNIEPDIWFWELIQNLKLYEYTDVHYNEQAFKNISKTLKKVINRTYSKNGNGGLFPLKKTNEDQTTVEIWYQMAAYMLENNMDD